MKNTSQASKSLSLWSDTWAAFKYPPLKQNAVYDVCIIGGGLGGITTAYLLTLEGKKVCVLESATIGGGQTGQTTAHFASALDDRYFNLEKLHGEKNTRLAAESHAQSIELVSQIVEREKIECDLRWVKGYLYLAPEDNEETLNKEWRAVNKTGAIKIKKLTRAPIDSFNTGPCLEFESQMQLHPLKYLSALAGKIVERGGTIYEQAHVVEIVGGKDARVKLSNGFQVSAKSIVVATNSPINNLFAIHTKQAPYRTYAIALKIPKDSITPALFWDTGEIYHYIRTQPYSEHFDALIVGGEDHKTGQNDNPERCFDNLYKWSLEHFSEAHEILYRWSGQVMEPIDGLAFLGRNAVDDDNVYVITGDSGNGMTHTTIGAQIICDQILDRKNQFEDLYSPGRVTLSAWSEFAKENSNVAVQYADWFHAPGVETLEQLGCDTGTVISQGLNKIAVYKNAEGQIEAYSAVCPHLKGIVRWNSVEKSWDCPCHGSRFSCHGEVIEGPAFVDLEKLDAHSNLLPKDKQHKTQRSAYKERAP